MHIETLKVFCDLVDTGSFSVAAAQNFVTQIYVGRQFDKSGAVPRLGADVARWYGETIGFWDGDALITWTSNIQGWMSHSMFEFSNKMQTIEIYTPNRDAKGNFVGLRHESGSRCRSCIGQWLGGVGNHALRHRRQSLGRIASRRRAPRCAASRRS